MGATDEQESARDGADMVVCSLTTLVVVSYGQVGNWEMAGNEGDDGRC